MFILVLNLTRSPGGAQPPDTNNIPLFARFTLGNHPYSCHPYSM